MQDRLEPRFRRGVPEDSFPHPLPVECAVGGDEIRAELTGNRVNCYAFGGSHRMRDDVGVDNCRTERGETIGDCRLAAADAARQSDCVGTRFRTGRSGLRCPRHK
jgi:hypothetical protein